MCGIFLTVGREKPTQPEFLGKAQRSTGPNGGSRYEFGQEEILLVVSDDLTDETTLTEHDKRKLHNVEKLRELQNTLDKLKNARDAQKAEEIRLQMEELSVSVSDEMSSVLVLPKVLARGPDYAQFREFTSDGNHFQLLSSVLSLRQPFTRQPIDADDLILQFNGELYNEACIDGNDTAYILDLLKTALAESESRQIAIMSVLSSLSGEFAVVLTDLMEHRVYFGKDSVGKRSLLYRLDGNSLTVSSVMASGEATECRNNQLYLVDLNSYKLHEFSYASQWNFTPLSGTSFIEGETNLEARLSMLHQKLQQACLVRQSTIHPLHPSHDHVDLGVLFSGGLDCTLIAALIAQNYINDKKTAVIDLLTVGFENPRTGLGAGESPDRQLSERSWFELCKRFCGSCVTFRLVKIDVSYEAWLAHRRRVLSLIYPCATEMDLSIAIAFYFACRASDCQAVEVTEATAQLEWEEFTQQRESLTKSMGYTSAAKVLFSGLGADELFGGYSRHENIFNDLTEQSAASEIYEQYDKLSESLSHDIDVIYERNLGRDDRAMSSWGKELRYPYLDADVIRYVVNEVEPHFKVKFEWATVTTKKGQKRVKQFVRKHLLRSLARLMGLPLAADETKRAIQFGAKSAKLEVGQSKTRGTDAA